MRIAWLVWSWRIITCLAIALVLWWNVLNRFTSPVLHLIWAIVGMVGTLNSTPFAVGATHQATISLPVQSFLVGLLLGGILGTARWVPADAQLLADLILALSPIFVYPDVLRWMWSRMSKGRYSAS